MTLVWKLLRQHVSVPQFVGFFFANLFGMIVILLGYQFYRDVIPVFNSDDSFLKADYLTISKKTGTTATISGEDNTFKEAEIEDLRRQPFVRKLGAFTSAEYKVNVTMYVKETKLLDSEFFFESVPDSFVGVPLAQWHYEEGSRTVPLILPKSYVTMYNFGYARNHSLPSISEGVVGMLNVRMSIHGNGKDEVFEGKVIGFSGKLNSILVPMSFMSWSNRHFAPNAASAPNRLIADVSGTRDGAIAGYLDSHGYEVEDSNLANEKAISFLSLVVSIVMVVGLLISLLSFYILLLSIYLLVQKNAYKLETLLLIGYRPLQVSKPYIFLTLALNVAVLLMAVIAVCGIREYYIEILYAMLPSIDKTSMLPTCLLGVVILVVVFFVNSVIIYRRMSALYKK